MSQPHGSNRIQDVRASAALKLSKGHKKICSLEGVGIRTDWKHNEDGYFIGIKDNKHKVTRLK